MLTRAQEKLIVSLATSKGREESGLCLVEGRKVIETAGKAIEWTFSRSDTPRFDKLLDVKTAQEIAAVARIPKWNESDIFDSDTVVLLDGVQDPGNVGAILRLCLGFHATLVLVECADPASPKVIRSSVGALFAVPWIEWQRKDVVKKLNQYDRSVYRLEKKNEGGHITIPAEIKKLNKKAIIIAGSEGGGIQLQVEGISVAIEHDNALESLNVGHALAIVLSMRYSLK